MTGTLEDDVTAWVRDHWDPTQTLRQWWAALADAGYAFPTWPRGFGGLDATAAEERIVARVLADEGVVGAPSGVGQTMGGPTVLAHGTDGQKHALVPRLAAGAEAWCQLFSEPAAGSDLAGLRTSAVRDGGEWVVNGQKVWNSGAHLAAKGLLLARTDRNVPKHRGISYFVIDMDQPGVEVRPLRQMNGATEFCEVFFNEARVPDDRLLGGPGDGWTIARTTLAFERAGVSSGARGAVSRFPGEAAGNLERRVGEILEEAARSPKRAVSGFVVNNRALTTLARERGLDGDPITRQRLAKFKSMTEASRFNGLRAKARAARGERPGPEVSIGKLAISDIAKASRELTFSLLGPYGMLAGDDAPGGGAYVDVALASFGAGFGGGTDEIQRNVISERSLGLPREPPVDQDLPFDEIPGRPQERP